MGEVFTQLTIDAPREQVFDLAQDYNLRLDWDPFLEDIRFISEDTSMQRGLEVWVRSSQGMEMMVEYITFFRPRHVSMRMISGPIIFSKFSGFWHFEEDHQASKTEVTFKYKFNAKWYFKPFSFVIGYILQKQMDKRLQALKHHIEETDILSRL